MKKITYMIFALLAAITTQSCKEDPRLDHIDGGTPAPQQVTDFRAENTPGGANIIYKLNADPNLAYLKAIYEIQPGVLKETKASMYTDTLKLEGFGETKEYDVKIYSVGKNEKESAPVIVKIKPLTPPVLLSYNDLSIEPAFGGVKVRIKNELLANLAIVLDADTTGSGVLRPLQTFYTKSAAGSYSVRGLTATPKKFSVYLRDRWGNKSLAIVKDLTPLFEQRVPKPFANYLLPTDQAALGTNVLANIWDGLVNLNIYASGNNTPLPQWFTIDLKVPVVLSRMKEHQRTPPYTYTGAAVKSFELWGSNAPASDGSWASWTLIGKFDSFKPSGSVGVTKEDEAYGFTNGEDFEMPDTPPAYRYLRFKTLETWGGTGQVTISEITFWGKL
jgi:hypothetical protein